MPKLNWVSQQNEVGQPSKTGETMSYINVKTCDFPFGFIWTGMLVITDAKQQAVTSPKFKVMFNQFVIKDDITTQEEALQIAEDWFIPRAEAMANIYTQLKEQDAQVEAATAILDATVVEDASSAQ